MGNIVAIYPTKFVSIDLEGNETSATFGLRVADDNASTYANHYEESDIVGKSPTEILELARNLDDIARDAIEFAEENLAGITIGDEDYTWEELGAGKPTI